LISNNTAAVAAGPLNKNTNGKETKVKHSLLSVAAASMLFAGVGMASAQNEASTTPSGTPAQGQTLITTYTERHYVPYNDPALNPEAGMVLPETVRVYPMPDTMNGAAYSNYSYAMVNNHPVVVVTTTRKVVHAWN
jgi:Protein of unknown function (DUF1236)